jgi:putative multiple sugar transport system substrate-binding protein
MASDMVVAMLNEETVTVTDTETYDNGVIIVPTYLAGVVTVTADSVQEHLVDSGFYAASELGLD